MCSSTLKMRQRQLYKLASWLSPSPRSSPASTGSSTSGASSTRITLPKSNILPIFLPNASQLEAEIKIFSYKINSCFHSQCKLVVTGFESMHRAQWANWQISRAQKSMQEIELYICSTLSNGSSHGFFCAARQKRHTESVLISCIDLTVELSIVRQIQNYTSWV